MWQLALGGLSLGLLGSLHCVGMCGPLALSLPMQHLDRPQQAMAMLAYNAGRVITYSFIGLLLGMAGRSLYLAGLQQWFSVTAGIVMLCLSFRFFFVNKPVQAPWLQRFYAGVLNIMGQFLRPRQPVAYLVPGIANGFLPCGMVYLALAAALSTSDVAKGVLFMFFFGISTIPAMLVMGLLGWRVKLSIRRHWRKLMPFFVMAMAVVLILRGLNLGIPFISPVLAPAGAQVVSCHK